MKGTDLVFESAESATAERIGTLVRAWSSLVLCCGRRCSGLHGNEDWEGSREGEGGRLERRDISTHEGTLRKGGHTVKSEGVKMRYVLGE